jgi:hypothetical protein
MNDEKAIIKIMETKTTSSVQRCDAKTAKIKMNVSTIERILMITSGTYLLYKELSQNNKSLMKIGSGGAMLLRGLTGYCPIYDAIDHLKKS